MIEDLRRLGRKVDVTKGRRVFWKNFCGEDWLWLNTILFFIYKIEYTFKTVNQCVRIPYLFVNEQKITRAIHRLSTLSKKSSSSSYKKHKPCFNCERFKEESFKLSYGKHVWRTFLLMFQRQIFVLVNFHLSEVFSTHFIKWLFQHLCKFWTIRMLKQYIRLITLFIYIPLKYYFVFTTFPSPTFSNKFILV